MNKFTNKKVFGFLALIVSFLYAPIAFAQDENSDAEKVEQIEEVVVTGSSIKRPDIESSLPLQIFNAEDIEASGVNSIAEFVKRIPSMQNPIAVSESVGGSGGGITTANLRSIGSQYTLTLLNGRRIAPSYQDQSVDISILPFGLVDRVDVLTDGASSIYGSDAIAGVVNFQLKDKVDKTTVRFNVQSPESAGGLSTNLDISTGGSFLDDKLNLVAGLSVSTLEGVKSVDRDFAKSGIITFIDPDVSESRELLFFNGSGNAIPANARVTYDVRGTTETARIAFNPYKIKNGKCHKTSAPDGDNCFFDYTSTLEILPKIDRNSLYLGLDFQLTDRVRLYGNLLYSANTTLSKIAPYPTGYFNLEAASNADTSTATVLDRDLPVVKSEVVPQVLTLLNQAETARVKGTTETAYTYTAADIGDVQARYRALAAGNRTTEYESSLLDLVAGFEHEINDTVSHKAEIQISNSNITETFADGWLIEEQFLGVVGGGSVNIFAPIEELDQAGRDALSKVDYEGPWSDTANNVLNFRYNINASVGSLDGGDIEVSGGIDYNQRTYAVTLAPRNSNNFILFLSQDTPYDYSRNQLGLFTEAYLPFTEAWEVSASVRSDSISEISDNLNSTTIGDAASATTYKLSTKYDLDENLSFRMSFGTGFKVASMRTIAQTRSDFGVTGNTYTCPFTVAENPLAANCLEGSFQSPVFREGNKALEPETSQQSSFGFVYRGNVNFQIDFWSIKQSGLVSYLAYDLFFEDPVKYADVFTTKLNSATDENELAIISRPENRGDAKTTGVDFVLDKSVDVGSGILDIDLKVSVLGATSYDELGRVNDSGEIVYPYRATLDLGYQIGQYNHYLAVDFVPGAQDAEVTVFYNDDLTTADSAYRLYLDEYYTLNYQLVYSDIIDGLDLSFGINNLLNAIPPRTFNTDAGGHQLGFDPRYYDGIGRRISLTAKYEF